MDYRVIVIFLIAVLVIVAYYESVLNKGIERYKFLTYELSDRLVLFLLLEYVEELKKLFSSQFRFAEKWEELNSYYEITKDLEGLDRIKERTRSVKDSYSELRKLYNNYMHFRKISIRELKKISELVNSFSQELELLEKDMITFSSSIEKALDEYSRNIETRINEGDRVKVVKLISDLYKLLT